MSQRTFSDFFACATGQIPYAYQCRLACGPAARADQPQTLTGGRACESQLINIPTGLGKTAAVVLAWLWNRVAHPEAAHRDTWPRRLVYCLPMRTLVEQTRDETRHWVETLIGAGLIPADRKPRIIVLMGGECLAAEEREWDIHPEADAILIGTQDMLLSRALNRGYGMTRARWPMHFGLLNNDALWVLDETQLMGVGVRTSAQLEGLRAKIGTALGCATWWASATLDPRLLVTPDHAALPPALTLDAADRASPAVTARIEAVKRLAALPPALAGDAAKLVVPYIDAVAAAVLEKHRSGTTTLVILNRVDRAKDLCAALDKLAKKQSLPARVLVHSRFRPMEREPLSDRIKEGGEKIIIATQAIEAGVDISARTLITELAPWSSLVQRFGRCNRKGEFNATGGADIFWLNLEADDPKNAAGLALPYTPEQLATARDLLRRAESTGVSPLALEHEHLRAEEPLPETHLLRRKDLVDLFDTTPDLAGLDLDVARYIRDDEERDVQVFWRDLPKGSDTPADTIVPDRRELVRVAAHAFKKFAEKNKGSIWRRDPLDGTWEEFRDTYHVAPGRIFLVDTVCGGYSVTLGWTGEKSKERFPVLTEEIPAPAEHPRDGQGNDDESQSGRFQALAEHTAHVVAVCSAKLDAHPASAIAPWREPLLTAARWHDVGKAHPCFQKFLIRDREIPADYQGALLAKAPWRGGVRFERPLFRHELASALAWLQTGEADEPCFRNLVAYLIATHHGKVRLSLRAMPGEITPTRTEEQPDPDRLYARGVWQGDRIPGDNAPPLTLDGVPAQLPPLDLAPMRLGETNGSPSWTARMLTLRDAADLGVFRLGWLESLLRAADAIGSTLPLANDALNQHLSSHDVAAKHHPVETASGEGKAASPLAERPKTGGAEHGLRERAGGRESPSHDTRPDHATRYIETTRGILSYGELAPLLAERVQAVLSALVAGSYAHRVLDEQLLLDLHAGIAGDLVPDWAGRWRQVEVNVGRLQPPAPHLVPLRMRDFCLDVQARWPAASASLGDDLLEFLAFVEGRFLWIHPFRDFNGRTIRLFLAELLRRLDLPPVPLVPEDKEQRPAYFAVLAAADQGDYRPLARLWSQRLADLSSEES